MPIDYAQPEIQRTEHSRLAGVDFSSLGFGNVFSDHMYRLSYAHGRWVEPRIVPYGPIPIDPIAGALHYGQSVFEGLKAFRGDDGALRVFRADRNYARMAASCERLCIPPVPEAAFHGAYRQLLRLDHEWVPRAPGESLYIRPIVLASEGLLEVRPAQRYEFIVATAPVCNYFGHNSEPVSLHVERRYTRAAPGGTGAAKTGGNYAASLHPSARAREHGCQQVLWLDGAEHRYVEEAGQMNIFFRFADRVVTPPLAGTILPGVTRESVLELLQAQGIATEERAIGIDEVFDAIRSGDLLEAFGAGTAAVIAPIGNLTQNGDSYDINGRTTGELTRALYRELTDIQYGRVPDRFGWAEIVAV